jgi:KUP system potassium uptake protein
MKLPSAMAPVTAFFLLVDVSFFGANIIKVEDGGWFPLLVGIGVYTLMAIWREKLFATMVRNAQRPTEFFQIPVNRVVELGLQVRL